ncbi:hypothetical protein ACJMK2_034317 [Sinanodonta woodiana]|uniref:Ubiquitin carboxyl-terminal hydrolase 36 n=1 Tax=Sinanodonta woodiana TaxID=1069815 RepID=A0ABD3WR62_SINWO
MPASASDSLGRLEETLKASISRGQSGSLDDHLYIHTKKVLLHEIAFTPAAKHYSLQIDNLRSKYIPLNPSQGFKKSQSRTSDESTEGMKMNGTQEGGEGLPSPQIMLYPENKVKLEWNRVHKVGAGLVNLGNTCFLNSTLQCLTYTPPLVNYCLSSEHNDTCKQAGFCMLCELQRHIRRCLEQPSGAIRPQAILQKLKLIARQMSWGRQEDAHEFLRFVIEAMQKACHNGYTKLDKFSKETTVVNRIFGGFLRSQVLCLQCKERSNTYDPFLDISLDIKNVPSLEKAFEKFVHPETLDIDNAYMCGKCKQKVPAQKRFSIHKAPNVLTIQLKRFDYNRMFGKVSRHVEFKEKLNIGPYMSSRQGEAIMYQLYGVLVHSGFNCNSGHYYCYVKAPSQVWYCMNDSSVTQVSATKVLAAEAYLLFYIKCSSSVTNDKHMVKKIIGPTFPPNHTVSCKSLKTVNGTVGGVQPVNELGKPLKKGTPASTFTPTFHSKPNTFPSATALPEKRDKVSFGLKTPQTKSSLQQQQPLIDISSTPRIVLKISQGKATAVERSPDGKDTVMSGDDEISTESVVKNISTSVKSRLVPYTADSNSSDSEQEAKRRAQIERKRKSSSNSPDNKQKLARLNGDVLEKPSKATEALVVDDRLKTWKGDKSNGIPSSLIFDRKLNATTSVPGNAHLLETAAARDRLSHSALNLMVNKPKDIKMQSRANPLKRSLSENGSINCVTSPIRSKVNATSSWHIHQQDSEPSPSVGSSSSNISINSTTEWQVTEKFETVVLPTIPECQHPGWKVVEGNHLASTTDAERKGIETSVDNQLGLKVKMPVSTDLDNKVDCSKSTMSSNCKSDTDTMAPVYKAVSIEMQDKNLRKSKIKNGDICTGIVSYLDKQHLLEDEKEERTIIEKHHKKHHKKHKKHKKHHKDCKYEKLVDQSPSNLHKKKKKKHKRDHENEGRRKDHDEERRRHRKRVAGENGCEDSRSCSYLQKDSSNNREFEWVEKTKDNLHAKASKSCPDIPVQKWDQNSHSGNKRPSESKSCESRLPTWDGLRSNGVVAELQKTSSQGFGSSVMSWEGGPSNLDKEVERERQTLKRKQWMDDDYDAEYDKGKTKKVKKHHLEPFNNDLNAFQKVQDDRNRGKIQFDSFLTSGKNRSSSNHHQYSNQIYGDHIYSSPFNFEHLHKSSKNSYRH